VRLAFRWLFLRKQSLALRVLLTSCAIGGLISLLASVYPKVVDNELIQLSEFVGGLTLLMFATLTFPYKPYRGIIVYLNIFCTFILCFLTIFVIAFLVNVQIQISMIIKIGLLIFGITLFAVIALRGGRQRNIILLTASFLSIIIGQRTLNTPLLPHYPSEVFRFEVPYLEFTGTPNMAGHNVLGYLGDLPVLPKSNEFRVLMLGNSTLYNSSIVATLQRIARDNNNNNSMFYNWSVVSQNSTMEVATILGRVIKYTPDLVILYDGAEDFYIPTLWDPRPGYPFNFIVSERSFNLMQGEDITSTLLLVLGNSHLIRSMFSQEIESYLMPLKPLKEAYNYGSSSWANKIVDLYLDNLDHACRIAEGSDFKLVVFLQPTVYSKKWLTADEQLFIDNAWRPYYKAQYDRARAGFDRLSQQYSDANKCFFIDLSDAYEEYSNRSTTIFYDIIHITPEGSEYTAQEMYKVLSSHHLVN